MLPIVLMLALLALQTSTAQPPRVPGPMPAECAGERDTKSCKSFNEMLLSNDKELLGLLQDDAVVCFRQGDDVFFIISFHEPTTGSGGPDLIRYDRYQNGTSDEFRVVFGKWEKSTAGYYVFHKRPAETEVGANVDPTEILFGYSFKNMNGGTTEYGTHIRRSTLRFSETYEWAKTKGHDSNDLSGYCTAYHGGK